MKKVFHQIESRNENENLMFIDSVKKELELSDSENLTKYFRVEEVRYETLSEPEDYVYGIK